MFLGIAKSDVLLDGFADAVVFFSHPSIGLRRANQESVFKS